MDLPSQLNALTEEMYRHISQGSAQESQSLFLSLRIPFVVSGRKSQPIMEYVERGTRELL